MFVPIIFVILTLFCLCSTQENTLKMISPATFPISIDTNLTFVGFGVDDKFSCRFFKKFDRKVYREINNSHSIAVFFNKTDGRMHLSFFAPVDRYDTKVRVNVTSYENFKGKQHLRGVDTEHLLYFSKLEKLSVSQILEDRNEIPSNKEFQNKYSAPEDFVYYRLVSDNVLPSSLWSDADTEAEAEAEPIHHRIRTEIMTEDGQRWLVDSCNDYYGIDMIQGEDRNQTTTAAVLKENIDDMKSIFQEATNVAGNVTNGTLGHRRLGPTTAGICCGVICGPLLVGVPACILSCSASAMLCLGPCGAAMCAPTP